jgi:hypothetical protein
MNQITSAAVHRRWRSSRRELLEVANFSTFWDKGFASSCSVTKLHRNLLEWMAQCLRTAMQHKCYRRCFACQSSWVEPQIATNRVNWASQMLARYPTKYHWRRVRFSDEAHLGYCPPGRIWVRRKPGERLCLDCIQQEDMPREEDQNKVHTKSKQGLKTYRRWRHAGP